MKKSFLEAKKAAPKKKASGKSLPKKKSLKRGSGKKAAPKKKKSTWGRGAMKPAR